MAFLQKTKGMYINEMNLVEGHTLATAKIPRAANTVTVPRHFARSVHYYTSTPAIEHVIVVRQTRC